MLKNQHKARRITVELFILQLMKAAAITVIYNEIIIL